MIKAFLQWRNEVNCRPTKKEKKNKRRLKKQAWNILSPLYVLIQIANQRSCVNLCKLRCLTAINLLINSNQLVLRSSVKYTRITTVDQRFQDTDGRNVAPPKIAAWGICNDYTPPPPRYATAFLHVKCS